MSDDADKAAEQESLFEELARARREAAERAEMARPKFENPTFRPHGW